MARLSELFNGILTENLSNGVKSLIVDSHIAWEGFSEEYATSQTNTVAVSPSTGNKIVIQGFQIHSSGNIGEISIEFDGGSLIGKLYTSQNTRLSAGDFKIEGAVDQDVLVNGGGDSFTVMLNYTEVEG